MLTAWLYFRPQGATSNAIQTMLAFYLRNVTELLSERSFDYNTQVWSRTMSISKIVNFVVLGIFSLSSLPSLAQQISHTGIIFGPSDSETQQLLELNRSNQANIASMLDEARSFANSTPKNISPSIESSPSSKPQPLVQSSILWTDNQGVWKLDKYGKQCAASSFDVTVSDPCI